MGSEAGHSSLQMWGNKYDKCHILDTVSDHHIVRW